MLISASFPPVRACLFDMDGLLIDSEDKYTDVTNAILREFGRPDLPWHIKATLQGRSGPAAGKIFSEWAQLPLTYTEFMERQLALAEGGLQALQAVAGCRDFVAEVE